MDPPHPDRVVFDVGGKRYKTTRVTINVYPEALLARLVSEPNPDFQEIFIDRNGELFQYVLDFYRNRGKVHVPWHLYPALLQEFEYYGFNSGKIAVNGTCKTYGVQTIEKR
ncbi:BTB/POZ protein [Jimgerdemannia flammicorona]|uniref:BTB/POZ protein n=1 Tax=Jimgerdemannia flammicorona TaxID=994334 RepID=A0A433Q4E4_9FUNG|nr:BTB/POZ protein [Jimgerdemannia flammicorona]